MFHQRDAAQPGEKIGDDILDGGLGSSLLREASCARIVAEALLYDDGRKYVLHAWCVMPNHVHVLVETNPQHQLGKIVRGWKTITARRINERMRRVGSLWAPDYFDRYMRDQSQYDAAKQYIEQNPVAAQLCEKPEDWPFSSAGWK